MNLRMCLMASTALGMATLSIPALAQQQAATASSAEGSGQIETVVVTGTNISGIAQVGSETITLDRDQVLSTGVTTLNQLLVKLPEVSNLGSPNGTLREGGTTAYGTPAGGGGNNVQGTSVNLRGIGAQATLILVDGHRLALSGTQATFTEANQIPLAALSRVDVIADGNSAIYGSDAVGGVVNFVMRKDYEGVEASARGSFVDGYDEFGASITAGHTWDHLGRLGAGNFVLSYDYDHRDNMPMSSRPYLGNVLTQYGGWDRRILGNNGALNGGVGPGQNSNQSTPGAFTNIAYCDDYFFGTCFDPGTGGSSYVYFSAPAGNGVGLTGADLVTTPSLRDVAHDQDYLGRMWRHQAAGFFNQDLTSWLNFYFEGFFTKRDTYSRGSQYGSPFNMNIVVNPGDPFYIAPPPSAPGYFYGGPEYVAYSFYAHGAPNWGTDNPDETWTAIAGFKATLPHDWNADLSWDEGLDHACGVCQIGNNIDIGAFQHQVTIGAINPYDNTPLTPTQLATFLGTNIQLSHMIVQDAKLKFDGPLFTLPGGEVKAAVGGEYYYNKEHLQNGANRSPGEQGRYAPPPPGYNVFEWDNNTNLSREVESAFAEVFVPIIGDANALPFVKALNVDAAVRYDSYSDFGDTTNPKIGLTWDVNDEFTARGSWGTSFRAPALTDINPFVFSAKVAIPNFVNFSGDPDLGPMFGDNVAFVIGAQPGIQPETAQTWSAGWDYLPHWIDGFKFSATYFNIAYQNQIVSPPIFPGVFFDGTGALAKQYKSYIHPVPANPGCTTPADYNAEQKAYDATIGIYGNPTVAQICSLNVWLDGRETNAASTLEDGVDLLASYAFESSVGAWNVNLDVTRNITENIRSVVNGPEISQIGKLGFLVRWRGRGGVTWSDGPWVANLFVNYVGPYLNAPPNGPTAGTPTKTISDWTTFDATVQYSFDSLAGWDGFKGTRLSLGAQNIFDRDPPIVLTAGYGAFDANNANPFGRIVTVNLTKDF
jgi:iron complex outermembrane receptor protein